MRVFVTGFSGYVGSHVAAALVARGHSLSVLAQGDQDRAVAGRVGTGPLPRDPDVPFAPPPPLAGRAALDRTVLDHGRTHDLRTFVIYGALVHGGAGAMLPEAMVEAARKAGFSAYVGDGAQRWSSVHVEDWAELIALALEQGPPGGHAFVAAGPSVAMREAAATAARAAGVPDAVRSIGPDEAEKRWQAFGPAFAMSQWFSADKAGRMLGWQPRDRDLSVSFAEVAAGPRHG